RAKRRGSVPVPAGALEAAFLQPPCGAGNPGGTPRKSQAGAVGNPAKGACRPAGDEIPAGLGPAAGGSQSVPPGGRPPAQGAGTAGEIPNTPAKAKGKAPRQIKRPRLSFRDSWKGRRGS